LDLETAEPPKRPDDKKEYANIYKLQRVTLEFSLVMHTQLKFTKVLWGG